MTGCVSLWTGRTSDHTNRLREERLDIPSGTQMTARFLTPIQDIAINLVFAVMGERRCNRTRDEYDAISARLPPLKRLVWKVNEELKSMHARAARSGVRLPQICRFKAGDERWDYEEYEVAPVV
jgi:hypothetical protein